MLTELAIDNLNLKNKMYFILTYDISSDRRLPKILKTCRRYLNWIQKSVFEGHLTELQYQKLKADIVKIINKEEDSVITFCVNDMRYLIKEVLGIEKNELSNII